VDPAAQDEAVAPAEGRLPLLRRAGAFQQRLVLLMGARLALALVSLGIALALDTVGDTGEGEWRGLYGTVAFAFGATVLYGVLLPRIRRPQRFAAINIATDIALVSALVHFSGGPESVFAFLYLLVATYGALLFDRRGALITAGLGVVSYGAVLLAARALRPDSLGEGHPTMVLLTVWAVHGGAIVLVAALSSFLAAELRRTGEALRRSTSELRDLAQLHQRTVESLMSGLLTTDPEGRITSFNPEAERITGFAAASALGRDVEEVLPGLREAVIERASTQGPHARTRMSFRGGPGGGIHLGAAAYFLRDPAGAPSGYVVIFQDVTAVVAMEEDLRRSERLAAVGELSAAIAHEIRNPLAAISGSIQVLERTAPRGEGSGVSHRLMGIVVRETDRLNRLITDFLVYARPGPLRLEAVSLRSCVAELTEMLEASPAPGVELEVDVPEGLGVRADPSQLRQVLWNLALNACQAMPRGGRLSICAAARRDTPSQEPLAGDRNGQEEPKDAWVEISVRDQGGGIPREAMDQLFQPFFTTKPQGTGLGLATVHRIVQEHGGSIRVESEAGKGTTFHVRLPAAEVSA
jgi:two-component system sensor histidine kinase PilS (NtrC family)